MIPRTATALRAAILAMAILSSAQDCGSDAEPGGPAMPQDRPADREAMVTEQLAERDITDPRVLAAMRAVPRHAFVPDDMAPFAYDDSALPIGHGQTISQPYIVALMTQSVRLQPDSRVLEVGTGSGYQAAVCAEITPHVWTIEIVEPLAERAARDLEATGYDTVVCRTGDGYQGWPEHAPFDAVLVTAAPDHVPEALFEQLAPGGRMCIPVGDEFGTQELRLITKGPQGQRLEERITFVRFVPMTGEARDG